MNHLAQQKKIQKLWHINQPGEWAMLMHERTKEQKERWLEHYESYYVEPKQWTCYIPVIFE